MTAELWPGDRERCPAGEFGDQFARRRLGGAGEVIVYGKVPGFEQPFWDVVSVLILFAPPAELCTGGVRVWGQVEMPHLHFEFGGDIRSGLHWLAPIGIAACGAHKASGLGMSSDDTPGPWCSPKRKRPRLVGAGEVP